MNIIITMFSFKPEAQKENMALLETAVGKLIDNCTDKNLEILLANATRIIDNVELINKTIIEKSGVFISFHTLFNTAFIVTKQVLYNFEKNITNISNIIPAISIWHLALESYISLISVNLKLEYNQADTLKSLFNKIYANVHNSSKKHADYQYFNKNFNIHNMLDSLSKYRNAIFHGDMEYSYQDCAINFSRNIAQANEIDLFKYIKTIMECINFYRYIFAGVDLMPNIDTVRINSSWIKLNDLYTDFLLPSFLKILGFRKIKEDNFDFNLNNIVCDKKIDINFAFFIAARKIDSSKEEEKYENKYDFVESAFYNYCKEAVDKEVPEGSFKLPSYVIPSNKQ